mgnify:CR=1 FL=1
MRYIGRNLLTGVLVLAAIACIFVAGYYFGTKNIVQSAAPAEFDTLWAARGLLERSFIGEIPSDQRQAWGATHGMVAAYGDPYTIFVEPGPREMERDDLRGHFGGIGAYMGRNEQGLLVLTIMRERPAARAGVQDNDGGALDRAHRPGGGQGVHLHQRRLRPPHRAELAGDPFGQGGLHP